MNIKEILKNHGITLSRFAKKMSISRPTLDSYISIYDAGDKIGNEKFQMVFDLLFKDKNASTHDFYKNLDRFSLMLKREELLGMTDLEPEDSDTLMEIFITMVDDFKTNNFNVDIYSFIKLVVNGYKETNIMNDLADYFLIINLVKRLDSLEIKQQYKMAVYYSFFNQFVNNNEPDFSAKKTELDKLKNRIEERKKERKEKEKNIKTTFEDILKEKLAEEKKKGKDISKLSVNDILELLNK